MQNTQFVYQNGSQHQQAPPSTGAGAGAAPPAQDDNPFDMF